MKFIYAIAIASLTMPSSALANPSASELLRQYAEPKEIYECVAFYDAIENLNDQQFAARIVAPHTRERLAKQAALFDEAASELPSDNVAVHWRTQYFKSFKPRLPVINKKNGKTSFRSTCPRLYSVAVKVEKNIADEASALRKKLEAEAARKEFTLAAWHEPGGKRVIRYHSRRNTEHCPTGYTLAEPDLDVLCYMTQNGDRLHLSDGNKIFHVGDSCKIGKDLDPNNYGFGALCYAPVEFCAKGTHGQFEDSNFGSLSERIDDYKNNPAVKAKLNTRVKLFEAFRGRKPSKNEVKELLLKSVARQYAEDKENSYNCQRTEFYPNRKRSARR